MARTCQRCQHQNEDHAKFCLSCGAMLEVEVQAEQADPLLGKVLVGRYRPIKLLGEGGMGRVYLAEQKMGATVRKVAIKTLHPELGNDPQIVARFHRECETVVELSHPNTIQFYDFGELEDHTLFIVMEFIEGRSLASEMEKGVLDVARVDKILIQVCGSLHEAHGRGIVHRDLKPENILLTDRGGQSDFVKVLDFGIAKKDDAEDEQRAKLTKQGMVLGTPPYMSPEQFSGKLLDARSDIYSLGIMVYEMLTGHLPFDAKTPWEWATKHLTAQPSPFEAHPNAAAIPANKRAAVMRALAKDREQRHGTVLEFLQEFTGYQDAQAAWTMATSSGGAILPKADARGPVPTPGPMPLTQAMAPPGAYNPNVGSQPGISATGVPFGATSPVPGGYGSAPGVSNPGYPYGTGQMPQAAPVSSGGGGVGKIVAAMVILVFVLGGAIGGVALYFMMGDDTSDPIATTGTQSTQSTTQTTQTTQVPTTPQQVMQPVMQPMQPTTTTTTTTATTTPDAGTAAATTTATTTTATTTTTTTTTTPERDDGDAPRKRGPTAAEEARARQIVAYGLSAAQRNDFPGAIAALRDAQGIVGRRSPTTRQLQDELGRRGANQVRNLLQAGRCPQAQQLYRDLRGVGAATEAGRMFDPQWCARP